MKKLLLILLLSTACYAQPIPSYLPELPESKSNVDYLKTSDLVKDEVITVYESYDYTITAINSNLFNIQRDKMTQGVHLETVCMNYLCGERLRKICPTKSNFKIFVKVMRETKDGWGAC